MCAFCCECCICGCPCISPMNPCMQICCFCKCELEETQLFQHKRFGSFKPRGVETHEHHQPTKSSCEMASGTHGDKTWTWRRLKAASCCRLDLPGTYLCGSSQTSYDFRLLLTNVCGFICNSACGKHRYHCVFT